MTATLTDGYCAYHEFNLTLLKSITPDAQQCRSFPMAGSKPNHSYNAPDI